MRLLLALTFLGLTAARAMAADAVLVGTPTVSPSPVVPGGAADVSVTLRAGAKPTAPVQLEVQVSKTGIGKLADAALGANQTKTYKIPIKVPADAAKALDLKIVGWGTTLGQVTVAVQAKTPPTTASPPPAKVASPSPVPSLTQTVTTSRASLTGDRGSRPPVPPPSLTQTLTTASASLTGNRGSQPPIPAPPSLTQTVTTPSASLTGNR
ncbi:MAG TPA: hypothetical protein VGT02_08705 [Methylomirabilota bacterium]|jgi:hypothetical protein|nr:hypothetical protein [Methylomirabilota bacterium]